MHPIIIIPLSLVAIAYSSAIAAAATTCPQHFAAGHPPTITNQKLQPKTREVCFQAYAVLHSGISRTPLYSAEHLTSQNLELAKTLSRKDSFHAESALPAEERAELSDYSRSGYDRGHMSPNADFATREAQAESFSLANMVPQVHANNAGIWSGIEGAVRQLAISEGELYVVSGPAFIGNNLKRIGNVLIPTHIWKMIYSPRQRRAAAYIISNDETSDYSVATVSDLERMVGIHLLPGLSQNVRDSGMDLPKPSASHSKKRKRKGQEPEEFTLKEFSRSILDAIEKSIQR